jgi:hypothetical protein
MDYTFFKSRFRVGLLIFTKSQKNFVKINKKNGVMQKPATHRKSDFTVLSFFYAFLIQVPLQIFIQKYLKHRNTFDKNFIENRY